MVPRSRVPVGVVIAMVVTVTSGSVLDAARNVENAANATHQAQPADAPKLSVRVTPLVRLSRGDARGVATVPRHPDNRVLRVILESDEYYSLSELQLDGEDAPQNHLLYWRDLPAGSYRATVQVYGTTGLRGSTSIGSVQSMTSER
jgi:hypothetical protein